MKTLLTIQILLLMSTMDALAIDGVAWLAAPVAQEYEDFTYQDNPVSGTLAGQAYDPDGDPLTYHLVTGSPNGTMVINPDGSYTYTPNPLAYGIEFMTYMACDNNGNCTEANFTMYVIFLNDPPDPQDDYLVMEMNTTLNYNAGANDIEPDNELQTFAVVLGPSIGTLVFNTNGTFQYTPPANYTGSVQILYRACDPCNVCRNATVYITIVGPNEPPIAADFSAPALNEDTPWSSTLAGLVSDQEGDAITFVLQTPPAHGILQLNANGTFTYTPTTNYFGPDSFTYQGCDIVSQCDAGDVTLSIQEVNDVPVAVNDNFSTNEDVTLNATVITNDYDGEPGVLNYTILDNVDFGNMIWTNGEFTYTPNNNYNGNDTLTYEICDAQLQCAQAILTIQVTSINDAPVALNDTENGTEDTVLNGSVANDTDPEGSALNFSLNSAPATGILIIDANGAFTFTPALNWNGTQTATYNVCDAQSLCSTGTLTINLDAVNDAPVAVDDPSAFTFEGTTLNSNVAGNDSDPDIETLTYSTVDAALHGTFTLNSNGTYTYLPEALWNGIETFVITACDAALSCDQSTLTIEVVSVNDGINAQNGAATINEDNTLNTSLSSLAVDMDGDEITFALISDVSNGTLDLQADGTFSYEPDIHFFGTDQFTFEACDPFSACDQAVFTITVISVNDVPVAVAELFTINEDDELNASVANDTDSDGNPLTYAIISGPMYGVLDMSSNGEFNYLPFDNYYGADLFTYQVCDAFACDARSVPIDVDSINDLPEVGNDIFNTLSGVLLAESVSANDSDIEDVSLSYAIINDALNGVFAMNSSGGFFYQSEDGFDGQEVITIEVCDSNNACVVSTLTINVSAGQTAPNATDDTFTGSEDQQQSGNVLLNDWDDQGGILTCTLTSTVALGTLNFNTNGTFTYLPPLNYYGIQTFGYSVCDATELCDQTTVTITINSVNDAPVAGNDNNYTDEDELIIGTVAVNDSDVDGNPLTYSIVTGPLHALFVLNPDGTYSYDPNSNFFGTEIITYQVCDGEACTEAELFLEVGFINDPPTATGESFVAVKNTIFSNTVAGNETDLDDEPLLYYVIVQPLHGNVTINQTTGTFSYTPATDYTGPDAFTYMACDPCGACAAAVAQFNVISINEAPVANDDTYSMNENAVLDATVAINDTDPDLESLNYAVINWPILGLLTLNADGTFIYTPYEGVYGTDQFTYSTCDAEPLCDDAIVNINIASTNTSPVANADVFNLFENQELVSDVALNDEDMDEDVLTYALVNDVLNGVLILDTDGSFTYTPATDFTGTDNFTYEVCDAEACDTADVIIEILEISNEPVAIDDEYITNDDDLISGSVALNDLDAQNDDLTFYLMSFPVNGVIEFQFDGTFSYLPDPGFVGVEVMEYSVCDNTGCDEGLLTINVIDGNETPVTDDDYYYANEDNAIVGNVSINDYDVDDTELSFYLLDVSWLGDISFEIDGSFIFTPYTGYWGTSLLDYMACDDDGACDTNTVLIEIFYVNDSPVVADEYAEVTEGEVLTGDVSPNDVDEDNDPLTYSLSSTPVHGIFSMTSDGAYEYTPFENYNGQEIIIYSVCDWAGCVTGELIIQITAINSMPIAIGETELILEDTELSGNLSLNDSDPDGDLLLYTVVSGPANGTLDLELNGEYTYMPNAEFNGNDLVVYKLCDELNVCVETNLIITVAFANDIPQVEDETVELPEGTSYNGSVAANDIELDEEILIYSVISDESNGLFEMFANGTYSYTPNDGFIGTAYVYYEGCDPCGACNDGLLTIVVTEVVIENYSPVANSITYDICQAQSFALDMDDLISDVESQDAALQITITPPATGNIIYNEFEHTLQYTADVVSADDVEINYTVCDNALEPLCASGTIYVNITASATPNISEVMVTHVDCHGGDDGSIQILALSGVGNLIVTWFDDSHDMEKNNLEAGDYTITVSSDALCNVDGNYLLTVSQPAAPLVASADFVSGISVGVNGAIDISISGGTAPYEIVWIGPGGFFAETEDINELLNTGQYTAYITDLNNCDAQIEVDITDVLELESTFEAQLMPNPADDHSVLLLQGLNGEKISYTITDASGRMVMQSLYNLWPSAHRELIDMNGWASGVYQLKLRTEQKQQVLKLMKQ